jgi:hypothetical protein
MTNVFFYETFDEEDVLASKKWVKSSDEKYDNQPVMIKTLGNPIKGYICRDNVCVDGWM